MGCEAIYSKGLLKPAVFAHENHGMVDILPGRNLSKGPILHLLFPRVLTIFMLYDLHKQHRNDVFENGVRMSAFRTLDQ